MNLMDVVETIGVTDEQKKKYCTCRDLNGGTYCLATTSTTCRGCKLYQFNLVGQGEIVREQYEKVEAENKELNKAFDGMANAVSTLSAAVESLHYLAREIRNREKETRGNAKNKELCEQIIAEANKIVQAGGNARFISFPGENKSRVDKKED